MLGIIFTILLWYFLIIFLFVGITMLVSVVQAKERFAKPDASYDGFTAYPPGVVVAFFREWIGTAIFYLGWPFGLFDHDYENNEGCSDELPPVLFIHGWTENRNIFRKMIANLKRDKRRKLFTINLRPVDAHVRHYREQVAQKIEKILKQTEHKKLTIVGHSLGGIIARDYIKHYGKDNIEKIITLASPHGGSVLAFAVHFSKVAEAIRTNSPYFQALQEGEDLSDIEMHAIASIHDNLVTPFDRGVYEGAEQYFVAGCGHQMMVSDNEVINIVREILFPKAGEVIRPSIKGEAAKAG